MGIITNNITLPSGISLNNVYISFAGEVVFVMQTNEGYSIRSAYKVFKDVSKTLTPNIRIDLVVNTPTIDRNVYTILYDELKIQYPDSQDVL